MSPSWFLLPLRLIVVVTLWLSVTAQNSHVTIDESGGYSDLVVGISDDVTAQEGASLIPAIKDLFTSASPVLYAATRHLAYFKQVTIVVPSHWPNKEEYESASFETFATSDVRVDSANPLFGNEPQTVQPLACGQPGLYIHLTPTYLMQLNGKSRENFGPTDKTLVHHWARFRYGIFEEYGCSNDEVFPSVYRDGRGYLVPNTCSNQHLHGQYTPECEEGSQNCQFRPDLDRNANVTSSLASYYFLPNNHMFCDDSDLHKHNPLAPNRHNLLCNHRSTWDVISSHKDFKQRQALSTSESEVVVTPRFKVVQRSAAIYSLVLDISGSMNESPNNLAANSRLKMLQATLRNWLTSSVRLGSAVGMVTFSTRAKTVQPLVNISDEVIRQEVISKIPSLASGYTCIGCGLRSAISDLKRFNGGPGGVIVLLTDGQENESPYIRDVLPELIAAKIRVVAIAFHTDESPDLETVAKATGGKVFFVSTDSGLHSLGSGFHEATTLNAQEYDLAVQIHDSRFRSRSRVSGGNFRVDEGLGRRTKIEVVYLDRKDINDIIISGPGVNTSLAAPTTNIVDDKAARMIRFDFDQLEAGSYQYIINRRGTTTQDIGVSVSSSALSRDVKPIIARAWIVQQKIDGEESTRYVVFAEVKKGSSPVLNADIEVLIEHPQQKGTTSLKLFDKGIEPDVTRNDGIYTGFINNLAEVGRYSVKVRVSNDGPSTASLVTSEFTGSKCLPIGHGSTGASELITEPVGPFDRVVDVGAVQVTTPVIPEGPPRITDLRIVSVDETNSSVQLNWTAPYTCGNGTGYEIRYSPAGEDVINFNSSNKQTINLSPSQFGEQVTTTLTLTGIDVTKPSYLAIKVIDKHNRISQISNVVVVAWNKTLSISTEGPEVTTSYPSKAVEGPGEGGEGEDRVVPPPDKARPLPNTGEPMQSTTVQPPPPIGHC